MKTIKVFLASSEELAEERIRFGNLIRQLDDIYQKRGIHIKLLMWEDFDPCYNNCRKQDEYNAWIRESQIFVALFSTKAGIYTREEYDVAKEENRLRKLPKLMIFCRDLQPGEVETAELIDFKQTLDKELGHFWGRYNTSDKLHLDFVMWLERSEASLKDALKIENGIILLDGLSIAEMDNLSFAAGNDGYRKMKEELEALPEEIEMFRLMVEAHPEQQKYRYQLQKKLDQFNALNKEFASYQQNLFATAKRIAEMQSEIVSSDLLHAINEFECGHIEAANAILDGMRNQMKLHKEQAKRDHAVMHQDIQALQLQTRTIMADVSISIEKRINRTQETFQEAEQLAELSLLEPEKYSSLLFDYGEFLLNYGNYDQAFRIYQRVCRMNEEIYGQNHLDTATSYNNIGLVYLKLGKYKKAMGVLQKALRIREKKLGTNHPDIALSYNNIGFCYYCQGNDAMALELYQKVMTIWESVYGVNHLKTATIYNNIGLVYYKLDDYAKAMEFHQKALTIRKDVLGEDHPYTATSYNNIGAVYCSLGNYTKGIEYFLKDLAITEKVLGIDHPDIVTTYNNIGTIYRFKEDYPKAMEYFQKALDVCVRHQGKKHSDNAMIYYNIGKIFEKRGDNNQALNYYRKALNIWKSVLGQDNPYIKLVMRDIDTIISNQKQ